MDLENRILGGVNPERCRGYQDGIERVPFKTPREPQAHEEVYSYVALERLGTMKLRSRSSECLGAQEPKRSNIVFSCVASDFNLQIGDLNVLIDIRTLGRLLAASVS